MSEDHGLPSSTPSRRRSSVCCASLDQAQCQPLTLLGVDDAETLAGMAAAGESVIDVLAGKVSAGYGELGLDRWLTDTREDPPPRLPLLEEQWDRSVEKMIQVLRLPRPAS
jgi:hypothetical protein